MNIGSLFSGVGGLELGLSRAIPGATTLWQVEQNEYARQVLAKHWPNAKRFEDVRQVGAHNLEPVDLICGGFPCQDISVAGAGAGIDGERSGLWAEYARIIGELRPRYVVVENVAALASNGMGRVLGDLAACGYDAVWDCVPAQAVGAHHRRDRVFIVAYTNSERLQEQRGHQSAPTGHHQPEHHGSTRHVADTDSAGLEGHRPAGDARQLCPQEAARLFSRSLGHGEAEHVADTDSKQAFRAAIARGKPYIWKPEPSVGRVADGVPRRVDRLKCLGNSVVPQVAEVVGHVVNAISQGHVRPTPPSRFVR